MFKKAFIPYKGYYSSPFCKWQGSFQNENAIVLGGETSKRWFAARGLDQKVLDFVYLGITIGQHRVFFGHTWAAHLLGASDIPGMTIMQACATATTVLATAGMSVEAGNVEAAYCLMVDRTSNGPHTIWPDPLGPGAEVIHENWNMDNFKLDPSSGYGTVNTAENVAKEAGFTREEADELVLLRYEQYKQSLADDRAFQKRYMFPVEAPLNRKKKILVEADEGVMDTSREALARLSPVVEGGIHTFGSQTHTADGNVGIIVATEEKAKAMSADPNIPIQIISYGYARAKKGFMPAAPLPAVKMALQRADLTINDIVALKNHNPFIANDLFLAKNLGIDAASFNNYGSSLVFGHPQAPTVGRLLMEAIEETVIKGGGYAIAAGCAAGDMAAALIVKVG